MIDEMKVKVKLLSPVWLFATLRAVAYQASSSMGFSRPEYWSGLPFPSPGDLLHKEMEQRSSALRADALPSEPPEKPWSRDTTPGKKKKKSEKWLSKKGREECQWKE